MTVQTDASLHPRTVTEFSETDQRASRRYYGSRPLATDATNEKAAAALMAAAKAACRPGERIRVVSPTEVHLVPAKHR